MDGAGLNAVPDYPGVLMRLADKVHTVALHVHHSPRHLFHRASGTIEDVPNAAADGNRHGFTPAASRDVHTKLAAGFRRRAIAGRSAA